MKRYDVMGSEMIKVDELKNIIRHIRKDANWMYKDSPKTALRVADDIVRQVYLDEIKAAKTQEEKDAILEMTGDFVLSIGTGRKRKFFAGFDNGVTVEERIDKAMFFSYESKAKEIAEQLDGEWDVLDVSKEEHEYCKRLMDVIMNSDEWTED